MKKLILIPLLIFLPKVVSAHCPLCTVGAGVLAVLAASIGISTMVVGVMIGGFALALSLWVAKLPKKEYVPFQYPILALAIFLSTIIPIMPFIIEYRPLYVRLLGDYGGMLHNTYAINLFIAGSILGALLMLVGPRASKWLTGLRGGRIVPYQGITISLLLLVIASVIIEILL
ncbi:MAG: hypothetical protein WD896_00990 [Parcubacteria group bacterium]